MLWIYGFPQRRQELPCQSSHPQEAELCLDFLALTWARSQQSRRWGSSDSINYLPEAGSAAISYWSSWWGLLYLLTVPVTPHPSRPSYPPCPSPRRNYQTIQAVGRVWPNLDYVTYLSTDQSSQTCWGGEPCLNSHHTYILRLHQFSFLLLPAPHFHLANWNYSYA